MSALLLALLVVTSAGAPDPANDTPLNPASEKSAEPEQPSAPPAPPPPPPAPSSSTENTEKTEEKTEPAPVAPEQPSKLQETVGISLVAAGAGLAAAGTASFTLIEALSTPDRSSAPTETQQALTQGAGFTVAAIASVGAVAIVIGAGMLIIDADAPPAPAAASDGGGKRY